MIRLRFRKEIEQQYGHKVQKLCKTSGFGLIKSNQLGNLDQKLLENVILEAKDIASIMNSLVLGVDPTLRSFLISHLASMKLLTILVIICRSAYHNNNNYILLFMVMYMYSAGIKVNTIFLLNRLSLSILYNVLLRKLRSTNTSSTSFIEKQAFNC